MQQINAWNKINTFSSFLYYKKYLVTPITIKKYKHNTVIIVILHKYSLAWNNSHEKKKTLGMGAVDGGLDKGSALSGYLVYPSNKNR